MHVSTRRGEQRLIVEKDEKTKRRKDERDERDERDEKDDNKVEQTL